MINRVGRKLKNLVHPTVITQPTAVAKTTYFEKDNQWYLPTIVGPTTFLSSVVGAAAVRNVLTILEQLSQDVYRDFILNFYRQGLERFGDDWVYADINTVLIGLSKALQVESYLEIGVRRGRSMAMVASQSPHCTIAGFDMWIQDYAGMDNPGKEFVREELKQLGYQGNLQFFDGDSKITIPEYFNSHPDQYFDMITVDGDHSLEGARKDIENVIPHLKVGGVLVFDDISNQSFYYLDDLWNDLVGNNNQFASYSFKEVGFGIAFAIKKN